MKTLAILAALALTSSCGGADDAKAKADFLKQAEKICAKAVADQEALSLPMVPALVPPFVMKTVAIADEATTKLGQLSLPDKDKAELEAKVLKPLQAQVVQGHAFAAKVSAAGKAKKDTELRRLLENAPTETKADLRWMKSYGFSACVEAADTSD